MTTFGTAFSRALVDGGVALSALGSPVPPEWILAVIALESGFRPDRLQGDARLVPASGHDDKRPEVAGTGGLRLSHGTGARGLLQHMPRRVKRAGLPDLLHLAPRKPPHVQVADGVAFWVGQARAFDVRGGFTSREALYCANLAPARLQGGRYDAETTLYSRAEADRGKPCYWPAGYVQNARPFGLDPHDVEGQLRMRHLAAGLDAAVKACHARYDAEVTAAYAVNAGGPEPPRAA